MRTFAIVTTTPNELCAEIHSRMPVILKPEAWPVWLAVTGRSVAFSGMRQLLVGFAAAGVTFALGKLIGIAITG